MAAGTSSFFDGDRSIDRMVSSLRARDEMHLASFTHRARRLDARLFDHVAGDHRRGRFAASAQRPSFSIRIGTGS